MPSQTTERFAVLAIDPGRTTGVAACHFDTASTLKETLLNAEEKKAIEIKDDWLMQGFLLGRLINRFRFRANVEHRIPHDNIHVAIEDFVLRRRQEGGATGDLSSVWVASAAVASIADAKRGLKEQEELANIHWQQPSQAKTFATNARLKAWGLYEPGSEHTKDAWRHVSLLANKLIP